MKTSGTSQHRPRGRPPSFDREEVLDRAVLVFWNKGYEGASVEDLTTAMGIKRPSLYSAFGSKRDLFFSVIDRYAATHGKRTFFPFLAGGDDQTTIAKFFEACIECATGPETPPGCLINTVATDAAGTDLELRAKLEAMFTSTDRSIANRLNGRPRTVHDTKTLAVMAHSLSHSIMTRARAGASREELSVLASSFMSVLFPE